MSKLTTITDRALELASQAGTSLKHAVPSADKLLQTGGLQPRENTGSWISAAAKRMTGA